MRCRDKVGELTACRSLVRELKSNGPDKPKETRQEATTKSVEVVNKLGAMLPPKLAIIIRHEQKKQTHNSV